MRTLIGLSSSGTDDEAAAANDSGTLSRSEQINANCSGVNSNGAPVVRSVAVTSRRGPRGRAFRSPKVRPRNTRSSRSASALLRPYQGDVSRYRLAGERTWPIRLDWKSAFRNSGSKRVNTSSPKAA